MLETEDDWTDSADDKSTESGDDFSENDPSLELLDSAYAENSGNETEQTLTTTTLLAT